MNNDGERARWALLQELFEAALDVPAADRAAHLASSIDDPALRAEVTSLLAGHDDGGRLDGITGELAALTAASDDGAGGSDEIPERVGPYHIVDPIARGGMGSVYLARHVDGGELVAVKLLRSDMDGDSVRRRFLAEREILARIDHPNIARLVDDGVGGDGLPYFVMEYVEGVPIDRYCDEARLPVVDRLRLLLDVCDAVEHAHGLEVVHRDLKPENVLVTGEGRVKLLDFGIAKILDHEAFGGISRRTTTGVQLLTPEYASPEQLLAAPITAASDLYQLGLLLYRLSSGRLPRVASRVLSRMPPESTRWHQMPPPSNAVRGDAGGRGGPSGRRGADELGPFAIAEARATTVDDLVRQLSGALDAVTMSALAEEPGDRPASVALFAQEVHRCLDRGSSPYRGSPLESPAGASRFSRSGARRPDEPHFASRLMKRIFGMGVGVLYFGIAFGAFSRASAGWQAGHSDIGFWWSVIAAFLTLAALSALAGTWIHTQQTQR